MSRPVIHHVRLGRGHPMVVLGGVHFDHTYFRPWLDKLAEVCTLIYVDHRGTGRSREPFDLELSHAVWLEDVHALAESLELPPFTLLGHSYGGFLAQEYALRYSDDLASLILADTAPALDYFDAIAETVRARRGPDGVQGVVEALTTSAPDDETLWRRWLDLLPLYFHGDAAEYSGFRLSPPAFSARAYNAAYLKCLADFNTVPSLGSIARPTLVLGGRDDWITPVEHGVARLVEGIPGASAVVFELSGHFPFAEEEAAFHGVLRRWLRERTSTAP